MRKGIMAGIAAITIALCLGAVIVGHETENAPEAVRHAPQSRSTQSATPEAKAGAISTASQDPGPNFVR